MVQTVTMPSSICASDIAIGRRRACFPAAAYRRFAQLSAPPRDDCTIRPVVADLSALWSERAAATAPDALRAHNFACGLSTHGGHAPCEYTGKIRAPAPVRFILNPVQIPCLNS